MQQEKVAISFNMTSFFLNIELNLNSLTTARDKQRYCKKKKKIHHKYCFFKVNIQIDITWSRTTTLTGSYAEFH